MHIYGMHAQRNLDCPRPFAGVFISQCYILLDLF